jgi:hypothetical protein
VEGVGVLRLRRIMRFARDPASLRKTSFVSPVLAKATLRAELCSDWTEQNTAPHKLDFIGKTAATSSIPTASKTLTTIRSGYSMADSVIDRLLIVKHLSFVFIL